MRHAVGVFAWTVAVALASCGCAEAPLRLYTLAAPDPSTDPPATTSQEPEPVIEIERVSMPGELDTEDIAVRRGDVIERSMTGRWVERFSLLTTHFMSAELAMRAPQSVVSEGESSSPADYRISIHISRMDVSSQGVASLEAQWRIISREGIQTPVWEQRQIQVRGPVATDQDVVTLERELLESLAQSIKLP